ncbi:extracellular solute-binding protein [Ramlibacter tataouinensis]|uniref:ABC transporter substrate-binding protein n=1 Tax=Ramlibacter tataouinensis TaxID=94132 RepID=UPI0022F3E30D|nr:extracellular solute-binding protein [Ramlibacter tataouinensis]WBY00231.1 extracellular solute-binding protein [Ramlibacter tataouinensis]
MTHDFSRRRLLTAAAACAAAGLPSLPVAAQTAPLTIGWYPGLLGSYFKRSFLDTFSGAPGAKVVESFDNARFTQMQANRSAPNLHVGVFTDVLLPLIARSGLVAQLDEKLIPNLRALDPAVKLPVGRHAVPVTYGTWGIAYNARKVGKPITGWADLLRDDLKGHVSAPNVTYNSSMYTLDALASLKGGSLREPAAGLEALHQVRTRGPGLWDQESIAVGWLKSGEIWATPYFSGNVLAMMKDPDLADLKFCVPSEGGYALPMSVARVVNPSAGQVPDAFINHMLGIEAQEAWARIGNARPVHAKAKVPAEVAAAVPTADKLRHLDWSFFAEQRAGIVDQWNKVVNR